MLSTENQLFGNIAGSDLQAITLFILNTYSIHTQLIVYLRVTYVLQKRTRLAMSVASSGAMAIKMTLLSSRVNTQWVKFFFTRFFFSIWFLKLRLHIPIQRKIMMVTVWIRRMQLMLIVNGTMIWSDYLIKGQKHSLKFFDSLSWQKFGQFAKLVNFW